MLLLENHVEIDEKCSLKHHKGNKQFFDCPISNDWVIEFNVFLDDFVLEDIITIKRSQLVKICCLQVLLTVIMINLWNINEFNFDWSFN